MTKHEKTSSRRITHITDIEDKAFKMLALHYGVSYKEATMAFRCLLKDIVKLNLLEKIDTPENEAYLNVPMNIVNSLARDRFITNAKPSRSKKETVEKDTSEKHYPILLKAAARIIELVEAGEEVKNARIRTELNCDYKVAKLAMDTVEKLYIPSFEKKDK